MLPARPPVRSASAPRVDRLVTARERLGTFLLAVSDRRSCVSCGSHRLHRSQLEWYERWREMLTGARPYRCQPCGARAWYATRPDVDAASRRASWPMPPARSAAGEFAADLMNVNLPLRAASSAASASPAWDEAEPPAARTPRPAAANAPLIDFAFLELLSEK